MPFRRNAMNFEELEQKVITWATDRNIFTGGSDIQQMKKLAEEYTELFEVIVLNSCDEPDSTIIAEIEDGIGDMLVVLIVVAHFNKMKITNCLNAAYEQIKDRKGQMVNGLFVKEQTN
jgi:hypothetical protein